MAAEHTEWITFKACKQLDFDTDYAATRQAVQQRDEVKLFWRRHAVWGSPRHVQFCKRRGRMNSMCACLSKEEQGCSDYEEHEHSVEVSQEELDS